MAGVHAFRSIASAPLNGNRVLVLGFENRSADPYLTPLGDLTADRLIAPISRVESAEVVPTAVAGKRVEVQGNGLDDAQGASASLVVGGAYYLRDDRLRFHGRIVDAETRRLLYRTPPVVGVRDAPDEALRQLEQAVAGSEGATPVAVTDDADVDWKPDLTA